jgi:nucleotide-binding universal stress UspA family protein
MFKRILWATDGSDAADLALPVVKDLATVHEAGIVVFHSDLRMVGPQSFGYPVHIDEGELKDKITHQSEQLREAGFDTELDMVSANTIAGAAHDIAQAAERNSADLIVVGSRGHTRLGGLLLGSVTQRLLHIAGCPVMVVPVEVEAAAAATASASADVEA